MKDGVNEYVEYLFKKRAEVNITKAHPRDKFTQDYVRSLPKQDKVIFKGVKQFWFTNIVRDAEENLVIGNEYTIKGIIPASSWTAIILEEFPDLKFSYSWFE